MGGRKGGGKKKGKEGGRKGGGREGCGSLSCYLLSNLGEPHNQVGCCSSKTERVAVLQCSHLGLFVVAAGVAMNSTSRGKPVLAGSWAPAGRWKNLGKCSPPDNSSKGAFWNLTVCSLREEAGRPAPHT